MIREVYEKLCKAAGSENVYLDEMMKKHTTFRIGGPADYFVCPHTIEQIQKTIQICKEENITYFILGNGSNLLVSDAGFRGAVIQIYKNFAEIEEKEEGKISALAGVSLAQLAKRAADLGLGGLEFASGIPGTVGGAVVMNAGAYGGEMKDVLCEVTLLDCDGRVLNMKADELNMGYRTSLVKEKGYLVLEASFHLKTRDKSEIQDEMNRLKELRVGKQPLEYPSAGSTFKRPEGQFAGKLIMDAGLRGYSVGGAQVSEKHCGFVINKGDASAADVLQLIDDVKKEVFDKFQVELEPEIKFLGDF